MQIFVSLFSRESRSANQRRERCAKLSPTSAVDQGAVPMATRKRKLLKVIILGDSG